jgi:O-antigen/teichoic acid export membrane protein
MHRQILAYGPASLLPAITSIAAVYAFTRVLSPAAFGTYSAALSAVMIAQAPIYALSTALARLYPAAERDGRVPHLCKTAYAALFAAAGAVAAGTLIASRLDAPLRTLALTAALLFAWRGAVTVGQAVNRMAGRAVRYTVVECGSALLGLLAGLALVRLAAPTAASVLGGLALGAGAFVLLDARRIAAVFAAGRLDGDTSRAVAALALPLAVTALTSAMLLQADRLVVGGIGGARALGVYAVAVSLIERPTTVLCTVVATATYPLAIRALESDGADAGRRQAGRNGAALIALTLPACAGLALGSRQVAAVLVGPEFRDGVAAVLPLLCATAFLRGVSAHWLEHAFQLGRRADLLPRLYLPAAGLHLACSAALVPALGPVGAALSGLLAQLAVVTGQIRLSRRVFPLTLPWADVAKVALATAAMLAAIGVASPPASAAGLAELVIVGAAAYGVALLGCAGLRSRRWAWPGLSTQEAR